MHIRSVTLKVNHLEQQLGFYQLLGLSVVKQHNNSYHMALPDGLFTLELIHDPHATVRPQPSLGLYHMALLLPSRVALAAVFKRLVDTQYPLQGASDHLVSEALYLADPEGNGIELYHDRPQHTWATQGSTIVMDSKAMDLSALYQEASTALPLAEGTTIGHVHFHVADLDAAQAFYQALGMQLTNAAFGSARFLSWNGYHHHVGINTWARGKTAPSTATGLVSYTLHTGHDQVLHDTNGITVNTM